MCPPSRSLISFLALALAALGACAKPNRGDLMVAPDRTDSGARPDAPHDDAAAAPDVPPSAPDAAADGGEACVTGATRCAMAGAVAVVELCTLAGGWMKKENCPSICVSGGCAGSCKPGERHCGARETPEACSPDGEWVPEAACPLVCTGAGVCGGACKPGSKRCTGTPALVPETCNEKGAWVPGAAACANVCSNGSCGGACMPGQKRCAAVDTPEACGPLGTWEPGARCEFVCGPSGECGGVCKPGARRCGGPGEKTAQLCDSAGQWADATVCSNLCTAGACTGDCMPGQKRCGANHTPETCNTAGRWGAGSRCEFACTGEGACTGVCVPGAIRCEAGAHQTCNNNGQWTPSTGECARPCGPADGQCPSGCTRVEDADCACPNGTRDCGGGRCAANDASACGAACRLCPDPDHGRPTCNGTSCGIACDSGYHDCSGTCVPNNNVATCGDRCSPCVAPTGGTVSCTNNACRPACPADRNLCGNRCATQDDADACGPTCRKCPVPANASARCVNDRCAFVCNATAIACEDGSCGSRPANQAVNVEWYRTTEYAVSATFNTCAANGGTQLQGKTVKLEVCLTPAAGFASDRNGHFTARLTTGGGTVISENSMVRGPGARCVTLAGNAAEVATRFSVSVEYDFDTGDDGMGGADPGDGQWKGRVAFNNFAIEN